MSTPTRRRLTHALALAAALIVGLSGASAQPGEGNLLGQARRERELATQKAEADLRAALNRTRTQSAAESAASLKKLLADIDTNTDLDPTRKADMVKTLRNRIVIAEADARARGEKLSDPAAADPKRARGAARRAELERQIVEHDRIKERINQISQLVDQGRFREADAGAHDLAREHPQDPAARVMRDSTSLRSAISQARKLLAERESSLDAAYKDRIKASTLPGEDLSLDKDLWKKNEKSKHRGNGQPLTKKEQAILAAMSKTIHPDWKGVRFESVIDEFQKVLGTPLAVDRKALEEVGIGTDTVVNLSLPREITVRSALRKVLQDQGLGYVIRDEMVYVTTLTKAREMMTTRAYYVGDLVNVDPRTGLPGQVAQAEEATVKYIIDSIKRSVDPLSWDEEHGGKASIRYDPITKSLIVRQSAEVHMLMRNSMR